MGEKEQAVAEVRLSHRNEWIDCIKGLCAAFVVLMHLEKPTIYSRICVPIFLVLFFFVSGYLFNQKKSLIQSTLKTGRTFLIYGFSATLFQYALMERPLSVDFIIGMFLQVPTHDRYPESVLWFIPCMMVSKALFYLINRVSKKDSEVVALSILASLLGGGYIFFVRQCLPWHIQTALFVQVFIALGWMYRKYEQVLCRWEAIAIPPFTLLYFFLIFRYDMDADLCTLWFTSFPAYCLQAVVGTVFFVLLVRELCRRSHPYI